MIPMRRWVTFAYLVLILPVKAETSQRDPALFKQLYDKALSYKITQPQLSLQLLDSVILLTIDKKEVYYRIQAQVLKSEILKFEKGFEEALKEIRQARLLAKQYALTTFDGSIYEITGLTFKEKNSDSARYYYGLAYTSFENVKDSTGKAGVLTRLSHVCMDQGKFALAMQYLNKAEQLIRKDDYLQQVKLLTNKAHAYSSVGLEAPSITMSRNAIALIKKHQISERIFNLSAAYGNICNAYLNIGKADSAYYFAMASVPSLDSIADKSPFLISVGNIYLALDSATQALEVFKRYSIEKTSSEYYFDKLEGLLKAYLMLGESDKVQETAREIIQLVPTDVPRKKGWMKIYQIASVAAAYLNQKELVYAYHKNYFDHYREIYNQENLANILQMDFEEKLNDEKIKSNLEATLLKTELMYHQLKQWGLFTVAALLIVILVLVFVRYRNQQRFNKLLKTKVSERTLELSIKNDQLSEYAFINAHKLRAPVARIMGLVNLHELENDAINTENFVYLLKKEVNSLDQIVRSISEAVKERKEFTREDVYDPG